MIVNDERRAANCDFKYEQIVPVVEIEPQDLIQSFNAFLGRETNITDQNTHH